MGEMISLLELNNSGMWNHIQTWLTEQSNHKSPNTIKSYKSDLTLFHKFIGNKELLFISLPDLKDFFYVFLKSYSSESKARILSSLKVFFKWALNHSLVISNIADKMDPFKKTKHVPHPIDEGIFEKIVNKAGLRLKTYLYLLKESGLRASEALNLQVCQIDFNAKPEMIYVLQAKRDKQRVIPIGLTAIESIRLLKLYMKKQHIENGYIFMPMDGRYGIKTKMKYTSLYKEFILTCRKAGLVEIPKLHSLRSRFATDLLSKGVSVPTLAKVLGHSNINTTMNYAEVTNQNVLKEIEKARVNSQ